MEMSDLVARIQKLESIEAIRRLRAEYCYAVDEKRLDDLMSFFSEKAKIDFGPTAQYDKHEDIRRFYGENVPSHLPFSMHMAHNAVIKVDGEKGSGVWYVLLPATSGQTGGAMWAAGRYDESYVKERENWKFSFIKFSVYFSVPYKEGWTGKTI